MKKVFVLILAVVLFGAPFSAIASGFANLSPAASPKAEHETVYVLTFCELYTQRALDMADALGISMSTIGIEPFISPYPLSDNSGYLQAECSAGLVVIRQEDLKVVEWNDILMYVDSNNDSFGRLMTSCCAAISALEYDVTEGQLYELLNKMPIAMKVYSDIRDAISDQKNLNKAFSTGNVLIYEGKYKYYIDGFTSSDGRKMIFITAK